MSPSLSPPSATTTVTTTTATADTSTTVTTAVTITNTVTNTMAITIVTTTTVTTTIVTTTVTTPPPPPSIINQSNPVLLKERVRIPRTRRAGGAAMLWRRLPLDGVGSCRLFFTDDLHDNLSWVPASDKPHTFKSCFTHSSQVFFGRPGPFLPGTGLDLTLFISPLERRNIYVNSKSGKDITDFVIFYNR